MSNLAKTVNPSGSQAWTQGLEKALFVLSAYAVPLAIALFSLVALLAWQPQYPTESTARPVPFRVAVDPGQGWDLAAAQAALQTPAEVAFTDNRLSQAPHWFRFKALSAPEAGAPQDTETDYPGRITGREAQQAESGGGSAFSALSWPSSETSEVEPERLTVPGVEAPARQRRVVLHGNPLAREQGLGERLGLVRDHRHPQPQAAHRGARVDRPALRAGSLDPGDGRGRGGRAGARRGGGEVGARHVGRRARRHGDDSDR